MILTLAAATVLVTATPFDTTLAVRPGVRLEVNNFGGEISIASWGRNAVRVEAAHSNRVRTQVEARDAAILVRSTGRMGVPAAVDYRILVPRWMDLKLSGVYTDVTVDGTQGGISAETVRGDVNVKGGRGFIHLSSIEGEVALRNAQGRVEVSSVNQDVRLTDVEGEITAETVNGDLQFARVSSPVVEAATVNGDVTYDGSIRNEGRYRFATHNGDVEVLMPTQANATVSVATFSGDFESTFPVNVAETRKGKRFRFTLGSGSAMVELESFQGTVRLQRSGERLRTLERRVVDRLKRSEKGDKLKHEEED